MLDIKFVRENSDIVKENIKKKFQDEKIKLVDEVIKLDQEYRTIKTSLDELPQFINVLLGEIKFQMKLVY